jgi:hypothetical protein
MRVRISGFNVLLVAGATALASVSVACGEFIRQDRSPVTLVIDRIEAASGETSNFAGTLQSDVETNGGIISDSARVTMRVIMKDVGTAPTPVNSVTVLRYRVTYRRADGRSTPGVDVPFPFDSATTFTVIPGSIVSQSFELVRHSAKLETPLAALAQSIGLVYSTIADVTFFGRDQAGNELSVTGSIGVQFGNFADPE